MKRINLLLMVILLLAIAFSISRVWPRAAEAANPALQAEIQQLKQQVADLQKQVCCAQGSVVYRLNLLEQGNKREPGSNK